MLSEPEKSRLSQTSEPGLHRENESEECVLLDEVCLQRRTEEEQQFDDFLWTPDLEPSFTHLLRENQVALTNSDCRITLNLGKDLNLSAADKNAKHLDFSKRASAPLPCKRGSKFTCNICGKILSTKNSLASHYRLHTGEKPFMCAQCGKRFAKKYNLDIHYNIHTGVKPYTCTLCPKSFTDPSAFRRHEWIHMRKSQQNTNSKYNLNRNTCGKCFLSKPSLAAHSQLHTAER